MILQLDLELSAFAGGVRSLRGSADLHCDLMMGFLPEIDLTMCRDGHQWGYGHARTLAVYEGNRLIARETETNEA